MGSKSPSWIDAELKRLGKMCIGWKLESFHVPHNNRSLKPQRDINGAKLKTLIMICPSHSGRLKRTLGCYTIVQRLKAPLENRLGLDDIVHPEGRALENKSRSVLCYMRIDTDLSQEIKRLNKC